MAASRELLNSKAIQEDLSEYKRQKAALEPAQPVSSEVPAGSQVELTKPLLAGEAAPQLQEQAPMDTSEPETQMAALVKEWRGTIRDLWQGAGICFKTRPQGSWKVFRDAMEGTAAFRFEAQVAAGDDKGLSATAHSMYPQPARHGRGGREGHGDCAPRGVQASVRRRRQAAAWSPPLCLRRDRWQLQGAHPGGLQGVPHPRHRLGLERGARQGRALEGRICRAPDGESVHCLQGVTEAAHEALQRQRQRDHRRLHGATSLH